MKFVFFILILYLSFAVLLKIFINPTYKYRKFRLIEWVANILFVPFMELVSGGKDSHWWDWKFYELSSSKKDIETVQVEGEGPQIRKYKRSKFLGYYNLGGLRDLFVTLFVLKKVVVLSPKNYQGEWSLVIKGNHGFDSDTSKEYILSNFLSNGPVKSLIDGKKEYLGLTKHGDLIVLKMDSIQSRYKDRRILFV